MITVALADDQALLRAGVRMVLEPEPDISVVGEAKNGRAALELVRRTRPDVLLLDIRMPGLDGLGVLRDIADSPDLAAVRVIVLTTFNLDEYVYEALRLGAAGFLLKDTEPEDLLAAVRAAARGDALLDPSVTRRLIEAFVSTGPRRTREPTTLTEREREVVALVGHGLTNDEIAAKLTMSPATARTHVSRAMVKLGARDRAQLVVYAYRSRLVSPD